MTPSLAYHLGLRLLPLVMSGVILAPRVLHAYDIARNNNLAVYWGQGGGDGQQDMGAFCQDDTIDNIIMAFLTDFGTTSGEIQLNLAGACSSSSSGSEKKRQTAGCSSLSSQIKQCQDKGKIVTLSLGGAIAQVGFSTDLQGQTFADKIWDMFLGGSGQQRPFGDAILDGVDLDIEQGDATGYAAFVNRLRELAKSGTNQLYITAAPQCPFPDAYIGQALNDAPFDAVYVQFYNNFCGLADSTAFNFDTWDQWAKSGSANPDVKVYIGALAGVDGSGFVDSNTLANYITQAQSTWSSFGGVMLWEASLAVENNNYHKAVKNSLLQGGAASGPPFANGTPSTLVHTPGAAPTSPSAHGATPTSLGTPEAAPTSPSAHGAPPTSLDTPGAAPTSPSAHGATPTSLDTPEAAPTSLAPSAHGAPPTSLGTPGAAPTSLSSDAEPTSPYADGATWHRRSSHFRNRSRAIKHSH